MGNAASNQETTLESDYVYLSSLEHNSQATAVSSTTLSESFQNLSTTPTSAETTSVLNLVQEPEENVPIIYKDLNPGSWVEIGQGSQGKVYKTTFYGTPVAIKVSLTGKINPSNAHDIVRGIKMLQEVRHPKIVEYMGVCQDSEGNLCLVTEYVDGGSLFNLLHNPSSDLTWRDNLLQFATDICEGMAYMHGQTPPILHRDLKSPNILITEDGKTAKIADFGFARKSADVMSSKGTERWCAPEVLSGNSYYTEKVDVYSFGIVLWELCTRGIPFQNEREGLKTKIINDELRPEFPSDSMPDILEDIYEDCVSSIPSARPNFSFLLAKFKGKVANDVQSTNGPYQVTHAEDCMCLNHRGRHFSLR